MNFVMFSMYKTLTFHLKMLITANFFLNIMHRPLHLRGIWLKSRVAQFLQRLSLSLHEVALVEWDFLSSLKFPLRPRGLDLKTASFATRKDARPGQWWY